MRLISQNGAIDVPYEMSAIRNDDGLIILCMAGETGKGSVIATYSTSEKAEKAMEMLRTAYTGKFVTNADVTDDFEEQLKELIKGGFGTVIVKDTNDSRVEFNNLNGYFQFPQDEDVEAYRMKTGNVEQMLKEFSDGTCDLTDNGKCTQCGQCCSNILPMTEDEISVIRRYIKKHHIKEHKHILPLAEPTIDMTCPFLDDSKSCEKCTIYEVRPRICRDFICCPSKRTPTNDLKHKLKCRVVDVRSEFFGKD